VGDNWNVAVAMGVVPFLKIVNDTAVAVNQAALRLRAASCPRQENPDPFAGFDCAAQGHNPAM